MEKKKLVVLGGSRYVFPIIEAAHNHGVEVITMDYLPDNIAHKYSDGYRNVSIVDKEAVCDACKELGIDGIMSFAADPGVKAAAYTAEKLGLPFQGSYDAVCILQNKDLFRSFLRDNGFNCPEMRIFKTSSEAMSQAESIAYPVIVKPTDSAGSKGCTRVDNAGELAEAVEYALGFSLSGACIVEQFLDKLYASSDADGFTVNGKFKCVSFTAQLFDDNAPNPYAPTAYVMPPKMPDEYLFQLRHDLQRVADLLGLRDGVYNIETRVAFDGKPYIMEISPRGGGNRLCEMLRFASGVDLIDAAVCAALGLPVVNVRESEYKGVWYQQIVHAEKDGIFQGIDYAEGFAEAHVVEEQLWIKPGEKVHGFSAANFAFGSVMIRFDSQEELGRFLEDKDAFMKVVVV